MSGYLRCRCCMHYTVTTVKTTEWTCLDHITHTTKVSLDICHNCKTVLINNNDPALETDTVCPVCGKDSKPYYPKPIPDICDL